MKAAILSLALAGIVSSQNNTLIPSNISTSCSNFLSAIDSDFTLANCVQPLINATSSFSPTSGANLSTDDINYTLGSLCKTTAGCTDSTIRSWLSQFYGACSNELTSASAYNARVRELYDILYVINPLKAAVCAIDSSNQDYCVHEIISAESNSTSTNSTGGANSTVLIVDLAVAGSSPVSLAAHYLYLTWNGASTMAKRLVKFGARLEVQQSTFATIITPNTTTYRTTNLPFLFLQPSMTNSQLCTPCTREIMVAYIKWESTVPYALGLSASPILGGQLNLWNAINGTCGPSFSQAITSEVGVFTAVGGSMSGAEKVFQEGAAATTAVVGVALVAGAMALLA